MPLDIKTKHIQLDLDTPEAVRDFIWKTEGLHDVTIFSGSGLEELYNLMEGITYELFD